MLTDFAAHPCGSDEIEKAAIPCEEGEEHEDLDPRACWLMEQPHIFCFRSDVFYGFAMFVWKFSGMVWLPTLEWWQVVFVWILFRWRASPKFLFLQDFCFLFASFCFRSPCIFMAVGSVVYWVPHPRCNWTLEHMLHAKNIKEIIAHTCTLHQITI